MAIVQKIKDAQGASRLADLLNGDSRDVPIVVVTIPGGNTEPWIDVEDIAAQAGNLADVYLMQTGAPTWEFARKMPENTQVYGGAGRVYPIGHEWVSNLSVAPLRFAFNQADGLQATQQVISDMLRFVAAAGLQDKRPKAKLREITGVVKNTIAGRALVDIGMSMPAVIAEELVVEDVSIDRLVTPGQKIMGWYDQVNNRVDVTKALRSSGDALAAYSVRDVVLAKVVMVRPGKAELMLYPQTTGEPVVVAVLRDDVTTNPLDDLRDLMTVGEAIPSRVSSTQPWALILNDVDRDEPIVESPSLLDGGPPWLVEEHVYFEEDEADFDELEPDSAFSLPMPSQIPESVEEVDVVVEVPPEPVKPRRPDPRMFDPNRSRADTSPVAKEPVVQQPSQGTKELLLINAGQKAEIGRLNRKLEELETALLANKDERRQLRYLLDQQERRANRAENDLKAARSRLRKAGNAKTTEQQTKKLRFADPEQGFRYLVMTQWATRTLPAEQQERPLRDYVLGPDFIHSLKNLEGVKEEKVADVVFEIVTGIAQQNQGREVHQLRTGEGGEDPIRKRGDGAVAWRASIQVKTPAARRIHYWALPNGGIEFARVATHDNFDI